MAAAKKSGNARPARRSKTVKKAATRATRKTVEKSKPRRSRKGVNALVPASVPEAPSQHRAHDKAGVFTRLQWSVLAILALVQFMHIVDFMVLMPDGLTLVEDVKGTGPDDLAAIVRIKSAAERFPLWKFRIVKQRTKKAGGGWDVREV